MTTPGLTVDNFEKNRSIASTRKTLRHRASTQRVNIPPSLKAHSQIQNLPIGLDFAFAVDVV